MTEKEKINKLEAITLLRSNMDLCFDKKEHKFSADRISEKYANDVLMIAFDEGVTLSEWEELVLGHLYDYSYDPQFILEQTNIASILYQTTEF